MQRRALQALAHVPPSCSRQAADYQMLGTPVRGKSLVGIEQTLPVFMAVDRRDGQQKRLAGYAGRLEQQPAVFARLPYAEEIRLDTVADDVHPVGGKPIGFDRVVPRLLRYGDQQRRPPRRSPHRCIPGPALQQLEILGLLLVLQVVNDRHSPASAEERRSKSGRKQNVQLVAEAAQGQSRLLVNQPPRAERSPNPRIDRVKIRRGRADLLVGFAVEINEILVALVDCRQRRQQIAQVYLGSADSAGNQVKRIDADAQLRRHISPVSRNAVRGFGRGLLNSIDQLTP